MKKLIRSHYFLGKDLKLYSGEVDENRNIFTIIIGKNGAGKSRLLHDLVIKSRHAYKKSPKKDDLFSNDFNANKFPSNIIALSTSPFDRFPLPHWEDADDFYHYQGLRGLYSSNLSLSFMTRIIGGLIRSLYASAGRADTILSVLDYLGYNQVFEARFETKTSPSTFERIASAENLREEIYEIARGNGRYGIEIRRLLRNIEELDHDRQHKFVDSVKYFLNTFNGKSFTIGVSTDGIKSRNGGFEVGPEIADLMEFGIIKLRDIGLHKKKDGLIFRISDASSGEQCVLMAMLGIASRICNNSLICIDEPEICLHPEWQERYINLLIDTFKDFSGCHFIIATHSPQIVSRLDDTNSCVVDLHSGRTIGSASFNKRSADFQLASLFRAPGYKNEYLMQELLSALTTISTGKHLTPDRLKTFNDLLKLKPKLDDSDPVLSLFILLEEGLEALKSV
ncbi:AAA family ATPase [Ectopseudomonas mendocina]|uniref:AAA family ATPase n=1 Tax=Ectopseudomonas mendocina TaxID=300 RepID=UPI000206E7AC|nr:AAA family ATPase [Pseudomonas mendocina]AEB57141.1 hypothetical protein MDS_1110 [Pseudomonas mendocina NK-01]